MACSGSANQRKLPPRVDVLLQQADFTRQQRYLRTGEDQYIGVVGDAADLRQVQVFDGIALAGKLGREQAVVVICFTVGLRSPCPCRNTSQRSPWRNRRWIALLTLASLICDIFSLRPTVFKQYFTIVANVVLAQQIRVQLRVQALHADVGLQLSIAFEQFFQRRLTFI